MSLRWSPEAATDFERIVQYIFEDNPPAAERIAHTIYNSVSALEDFPNRGRVGRVAGTRELVLAPLPFIVVYRVSQAGIDVVRVLHGSQRWP